MRPAKEQHIVGVMGGEMIQNGRDPLNVRRNSGIDLFSKVDAVGNGAPRIGLGEDIPGGRAKCPKDVPFPASSGVAFLLGAHGWSGRDGNHLLTRK